MDKYSTKDSVKGWAVIILVILLIWGAYEACNYTSESSNASVTEDVVKPLTEQEIQAEEKALLERRQNDSIANAQYQKEAQIAKKKWENSKAGKIQKKHPEWSNEDCERIANNKIWIGMHIKMVAYIRGNPDSANPSDYGYGREWQWCWHDYSPSCFYGSDDGIVRAYN